METVYYHFADPLIAGYDCRKQSVKDVARDAEVTSALYAKLRIIYRSGWIARLSPLTGGKLMLGVAELLIILALMFLILVVALVVVVALFRRR